MLSHDPSLWWPFLINTATDMLRLPTSLNNATQLNHAGINDLNQQRGS